MYVANAVARVENLEFLTDVVPKTTTYRQHKQKQAKDGAPAAQANGLANGQSTLDQQFAAAGPVEVQATNGAPQEIVDVVMDETESMHTAHSGPIPAKVEPDSGEVIEVS